MSMTLRPFASDDVAMLASWEKDNPENVRSLRDLPDKAVVENGHPVGIVGMVQYGPVADVHVLVDPLSNCFKTVSRVYDLALDEARRRGVRYAVGMIPHDNRPALMMAHRKGFKTIPAVVMVKDLDDGR